MIGLFALSAMAFAVDPASIEAAVSAEMSRAMSGLMLPEQQRPHHITVTVSTGTYATVRAHDGAVTEEDTGCAIFPVEDSAVDFGTNNQHIVVSRSPGEASSNI